MIKPRTPEVLVTGLGVTTAIGQGQAAFTTALMQGRHRFGFMERKGRQLPSESGEQTGAESAPFIGAEIPHLALPGFVPAGELRTASFSAQVAVATLHEAWTDAKLHDAEPRRVGLIVGGSNFQQRELVQMQDAYRNRAHFLRPSYGMSFMDSDVCGLCTQLFSIQGFACTTGGASASGQLAVVQAAQAVKSGQVDVCIALGALMDLSYWEFQSLKSLGAMGSQRFANEPALACRPFDQARDGFIFGEACGALVVESAATASRRGAYPYARLLSSAVGMDGNRNPNPSLEGEINVIHSALADAGLSSANIDYINPHGSGSAVGDEVELRALNRCELQHAYINATKSVIGHGLSAAGAVEIIATLLQMKALQLHPTRNLENPIDPSCNWVRSSPIPHAITNALTLSIGFGGINSALCLQRC